MRTKHPILRRDISRRQSRIERFRRCLCSVCDAGSQTVSALKGDVPGGSLERLGEPSRYLTVVWNASMSEPRHPLCEGYYTRLVGLRRSLARYSRFGVDQWACIATKSSAFGRRWVMNGPNPA